MPVEKLYRRKLEKVGVVGCGRIGPEIALYLARALPARVVVVDISPQSLEEGKAEVRRRIEAQLAAKRLKPAAAEAIDARMLFTDDYAELAGAELVIEATNEELKTKHQVLARVEEVASDTAVITSTSSHLEPHEIFGDVVDPRRAAITRFFPPADQNPVVEVAVCEPVAPGLADELTRFFELNGKVPLMIKRQRCGFAIEPVVGGVFLAACLAVQRGLATVEQVDAVCQRVLGLRRGPFQAANAAGHAAMARSLAAYHSGILRWFRCPELLVKQIAAGEPWSVAGAGDKVEVDEETFLAVSEWMLGATFAVACEVLDAGIVELSEYDEALGLGVGMTAPFTLMNRHGLAESLRLLQSFAQASQGVKICQRLTEQVAAGQPWPLAAVKRQDRGEVAVLTIRRFKVLNALNGEVLDQLRRHVAQIDADEHIRAVVITGFGTRAFVSGADINELARLESADDARAMARRGQRVFSAIEQLDKPVIAAMNGLAFGGGNELAMACHARLAAAGQKVFAGQPEPKLGIIPGYGGTQRLPRLIGIEAAWPLLRTGQPISSAQAAELGLIREEVSADELLDRAIDLASAAAAGEVDLPRIERGALSVPDQLAEVDIGGLSTAVDEILRRATLDGARLTLAEGLRVEAEAFGSCLETEDCRIGLDNFVKNGPKVAAPFVNR